MNNLQVEKSFYQLNKKSYYLIMLSISFNIYYMLRIYNLMNKDYHIGTSIIFNISLLLFLFLSAVKNSIYDLKWGYLTIALGLFQIVRSFLFIPQEIVTDKSVLITVLIISGLLLIGAGALGVFKTTAQIKYKKAKKDSQT